MADYILSADSNGRQRYRNLDTGRLMPAGFKPPGRPTKKKAAASKKAAARKGVSSNPWSRGSMDAFLRTAGKVDDATIDRQSAPLRQVSMLGVDPRSPEGQAILSYLQSGMTADMAEVQAEVQAYQEKLLGPVTRSARKESVNPGAAGMYGNQYGFVAGDEFRQLDMLSTEILTRTQYRMTALGILGPHVSGRKDEATIEAFRQVLTLANGEGQGWANMLGSLEKQKAEMGDEWAWDKDSGADDGPAPFVRDTYLAPDYATLAQTVKSQMRDALGRDPDENELALFTAEMSGWDRDAFEAEQAGAEQQYSAQVEAGQEGTEGLSGGEGQAVDPMARFKQSFDSRFRGAIAFNEDRDEVEETQKLTSGAVSTLSQMSGGLG